MVGSGGKTTLLAALAEELEGRGGTILTTTTHILPFHGLPLVDGSDLGEIAQALSEADTICAGLMGADGKLTEPPAGIEALARLARHVLVEADGSKRLPLKAHEPHEPVIPTCSARTILVVGASGLMRPVSEAVHRPKRFCELAACGEDDLATPERVARAIAAEGLADRVIVNQVESSESMALARRLAMGLDVPVFAGSIRKHELARVG